MPAEPREGECFGDFYPCKLGRTKITPKLEQSKRVCRRVYSVDETLSKLCHLLALTVKGGGKEGEFRAANPNIWDSGSRAESRGQE